MATQTTRPETLVDDPAVWFGISLVLVIITFLVAGLAQLDPGLTATAVVVVAGLSAARLPGMIALALGVVAWAFYTGFTENSFGQLTFASGDLIRLASFAVATAALSHLVRNQYRKEASHG